MSTTLLMPMSRGLVIARRANGTWKAEVHLPGHDCWAVVVDPHDAAVGYCGSHDGLFKTEDGGRTWRQIGQDIPRQIFWSVAVSSTERDGEGRGAVYVGTEMTMLYRSEDAGNMWQDSPAIEELPSKPTWKFPPKPKTHHLRCICLDPHAEGVVIIGIEQGGIMRSTDFGRTWRDRQPDGKMDAHTILTHPKVPGRVYVAAGDGYSESRDHGDTWTAIEPGLERHHYLMGLGVDPGDPEALVTTNSRNWFRAHFPPLPSNTVYRKTGDGPWQEVTDGLPRPLGQRNTGRIATNRAEPHTFYFGHNDALIFRSGDAGKNWEELRIEWPDGFTKRQLHHLAIEEID